jgi:hypothetical protein
VPRDSYLKRDDLAPISGVFMTQVEIMQALVQAIGGNQREIVLVDLITWANGGVLDLTGRVRARIRRGMVEAAFRDPALAAYIALRTHAVALDYNGRTLSLMSDSIGPLTVVFRDSITNTEIAYQTTKALLAAVQNDWPYFCMAYMDIPYGSMGDLWLVSRYSEQRLAADVYVYPPTPNMSDNE